MIDAWRIAVIIPALDEAPAISAVVKAIPALVDRIMVVDNGSKDATAELAARAGAQVINQPRRGYGWACQAGIEATTDCQLLVFLDADASQNPADLQRLIEPILCDQADLVIGSRRLGLAAPGALNLPQRLGNALACGLIRLRWRHRFTDLGPFRAIRRDRLLAMRMREMTFGWTVEMQIKALQQGCRVQEIPVDCGSRIGQSKISGTVTGVLKAGFHILKVIARA